MRERLARWWAHRKLSRGRCAWCGRVLPDDARTVTCSEVCAEEMVLDRNAW